MPELYSYLKNVLIPTFIYYKKEEFPGFTYVKTVDAVNQEGHILQGNGYYYLCMRLDGMVSTNEGWNEPIGFKRKSLEEIDKLIASFRNKREVPSIVKLQKNNPEAYLDWKKKIQPRKLKFTNIETGETINYTNLRLTSERIGLYRIEFKKRLKNRELIINGWRVEPKSS